MIAKILGSSNSFPAVNYNNEKISEGKGELIELINFPLGELTQFAPNDVKQHLHLASSIKKNDNFNSIQFHASISCKGKEFDKMELADIGKRWMGEMGYGKQPYAIIFHSDTQNNHIHIVSTRVNIEDGKKINDSNERYRSRAIINKIMEQDYGRDNKFKNENNISNFLKSYSFDSYNSLKTLLNSENKKVYLDKEDNNILNVYNADWKGQFKMDELKTDYTLSAETKKKYQALLYKYSSQSNTQMFGFKDRTNSALYKYDSDFTQDLKHKLGIEIKPVIRDGKITNYTLIDHNNKLVLNGNSIINSKVLFKESIKELDHDLINTVNKFNIDSAEKLEAIAHFYKIPKFAIQMNFNLSNNNVLNSYINYLMDNPNMTIEQFAEATKSSLVESKGQTYILNSENGFCENINVLRQEKENKALNVDSKFGVDEEFDFGSSRSVVHEISSALKTGNDNDYVDTKKSKGKRKKR